MDRLKVILLAAALAAIGGLAPILLMGWLAMRVTQQVELHRLHVIAGHILLRTELSLDNAHTALEAMAVLGDKSDPCSQSQIADMRRMTADTPSIEEIGYFDGDLLKCTSWGLVDKIIVRTPIAFTLPDGLQVSPKIIPAVTGGIPMMAVQLGSYNALINTSRFTDIMADPRLHLALAWHTGLIVNQSAADDQIIIRNVLDETNPRAKDRYLYAKVERNGWMAVAAGHRADMLAALRAQQLWMIPIGIFISAFIVLIVVRLSRRRLSPEAELRIAVKKREFFVHYQPIMEFASGRCVGAEALVRWQRPDGTVVRPDLFIPLAEDSGIITQITDQVIECVMRDLGEALVSDRSLHIAINICAADLKGGRVLATLTKALAETGIRPDQIWLELTERSLLDVASVRLVLNEARAQGHAVAIDDFGTGYSSLQYLQSLPLDALKIDKSFVSTIGRDAVSSSLVGHIIDMAKALNLQTIAEGVETQDQAEYLAARGVEFAQGWLYAKSLPAGEFIAFCSNSQSAREIQSDLETAP